MSKEFNYKEELKRMFKSLGGNGNGCGCVDCNDCPLDSGKFENKESRCAGIGYEDEAVEIVRRWSEEHPERKIDWRKVPRDTKVLVRDNRNDKWEERYYAWYNEGRNIFMCFNGGVKSYESNDVIYWFFCKLADGVDPKEEWYED